MSRIIANNIRHNDATADSLSFDSSGNVSVPNDLAVNTDTLFVDVSTDRVGIGTTNPSNFASNANKLVLNTGGNGGLTIATGSSSNGHIFFADGTTGDQAYRGIIKYEHGNDAMTFGTAGGTERLRILSGGGLTFNGDTATANALDDYEEGTFTPTINSGYTVTYDTNAGRYVKIGKQVAIWLSIDTNVISGTSSDTYAYINGLPFTVRNSGYIETGFAVGWQYQLANNVDHAYADGNSTRLVLLGPNSSGSRTHWNPDQVWANTTNDRRISISGVYWTDA